MSRSNSHILSSIQKYGYSSFSLDILEYCNSSELLNKEQYYIDLLKPNYNILKTAGSSLGRVLSEETKEKIALSITGKVHSDLVKQKMSITRTGLLKTEETKKILSELRKGQIGHFTGKQHSEESKEKMRAKLGSKLEVINTETNETKLYLSNYQAAEALNCSE